jgi:hypothetical protein
MFTFRVSEALAEVGHRTMPWLLLTAMTLTSCATPAATSSSQSATASTTTSSESPTPSESALPTAAASGFAFSVDGVIGYYQGKGYVCSTPQPSTTAAGYIYRSCQAQDPAGRALVVGLVTDPRGALADAFASVQGKASETIPAPSDALNPLSAFLGAMLGEDRGDALLMWLAGHLGDDYAQTTSTDLKVATYTASQTDHSRLYVEIANQSYLDAPTPSSR